ncbi:hypothetical protein [Streptomyces sp. NPDC013187]|uniref:hypothetical protein n=1 Tax=Streptomyces sp. NPDC013187 TaxID=3364865 RepID=UPI0036870B06
MERTFRYWAERIVLGLTAAVGVIVTLADQLDLLDGLAGGTVGKLTLLTLSTVTLFLLFEIDRLKALDNISVQLSKLDIDALARDRKRAHYGGVVRVHRRFPEEAFEGFLNSAEREVTILQTWIPNVHRFESALKQAIADRRVRVRVLPSTGSERLSPDVR